MDYLDPEYMKKNLFVDLNDIEFGKMVSTEMVNESEENLKHYPKELSDKAYLWISSMALRLKEADKEGRLSQVYALGMVKLLGISPDTEEFAYGANLLLYTGCKFLAAYGSKEPMSVQPTFNKLMTEASLIRSTTKEDYDPDKVAPETVKQYPTNIAELLN